MTDEQEMFHYDFGTCDCGGKLVPVFNQWESDEKIIRGIDVLRCENCFRDYPAPPDFDEVVKRL